MTSFFNCNESEDGRRSDLSSTEGRQRCMTTMRASKILPGNFELSNFTILKSGIKDYDSERFSNIIDDLGN